ncbi:MAG: ImmA/IrrE family metallo-endopeptidase [Dehalococcoidia bacterium]|nr:ImmA/IrrE family metallo-endopeptidase [Dehalococcoidia bacterium]
MRIGLTPSQVASLSGITAGQVEAWESCQAAPELADLEVLAELYLCPVGYFFLDDPPPEEVPLDFRGLAPEKSGVLSYETNYNLRHFVRLVEYASTLVRSLGLEWTVTLGDARIDDPVEDIAKAQRAGLGATLENRRKWASANEAFQFWRRAIEDAGVFVFSLKLDPKDVRGASYWAAPSLPAILVNRADAEASTGRTFTLLHEWAHLLIKEQGVVCDFRGAQEHAGAERFANALAAEMILPRDEFEAHVRKENLYGYRDSWGDQLIDRARTPFRVSRDVVAVLLEDLELAPRGFYRRKRAAWEQRSQFFARVAKAGSRQGMTKSLRKLNEFGLSMSKLVTAGYQRGAVSTVSLADLLDMKIERAQKFADWVASGAREQEAP